MKRILIGLVLAVLLFPQASALTWVRSCINDTHMFEEAKPDLAGTNYEFNHTIYCRNNCSNVTLTCMPDTNNPIPPNIFAAVLVLMGVAAMFLFISVNIKERHPELAFMFLVMPLFFIIASLGFIGELFSVATQGNLQNIIYGVMFSVVAAMILTILVLMFKIIIAALKGFFKPKETEKELKEL